MYSKKTEGLVTQSISDYYSYLEKTGYMRVDKVAGLLCLAFVNRMLNSRLSVFVSEDDYRDISRFLYKIIGYDCLVGWPEYTRELAHVGDVTRKDTVPFRLDERGLFRYVQNTPIPRVDDTSYTYWAPVPFRIYVSPDGTETTINGESVDSVMCVPGDTVEWSVSKDGYVSQEGSEVVTEYTIKSIRLEEQE